MKKKILATYINEFNYKFIIAGAKKYKCQNIQKIFNKKKIVTYTKDKIQNKNLDPWVQNVSINTGKPSKIHKVYNLGQNFQKKQIQIWDHLSKKKIKSIVWGPMNATFQKNEYLKVFFPDPWNFSQKTFPYNLNYLSKIQSYYAKNYLDLKLLKIVKYSFLFLWGLVRRGYLFKCLSFFPKIFPIILLRGFKNYILFLLLDLISTVAVNKEVKRNNPEFTILFLNSIAHFQHNHWNEERHQKIFFKFLDIICFELISLEQKFNSKLIFNGFSQIKIKSEHILRPINPSRLLKNLGIKFAKLEQNMTNGGIIFFKNSLDRTNYEKLLKSICFEKFYFFEIKKIDNKTIFYRVQVKLKKDINFIIKNSNNVSRYLFYDLSGRINRQNIKKKNLNIDFLKEFLSIKSSGVHYNKGLLLYDNLQSNKNISKIKKIENHKIFNLILSSFHEKK